MARRFAVALVLTLCAVLARGTAAAPRHGPAPAHAADTATADYCADSEDMAFLKLINDYRAQSGLQPVALTQTLGAASYHHSLDMANNNYVSHTLFDGTTFTQNMINHGYTNSGGSVGENIAGGYATASAVFTAWKNSAGHNANMLSSWFTAIGIGRAYSASSTYGWYWTTDFGGYVDGSAVVCGTGAVPAATNTPPPTATNAPAATPTNTPKPTSTSTPLPTSTNTPAPTATNTPQPTATRTPATAVYVASMSGKASTKGSTASLTVNVTIRSSKGSAVGGAGVSVAVAAPDGSVQTLTGTTNGKGQVSWSVKATHGSGTYVASVTGVSAAVGAYDPTLNLASSVSIAVP